MFQQSTTTVAQAQTQIAEAAGKQASTAMLARALKSLQAAFRKWNTATKWEFTRTIAADQAVTSATELYDLPWDLRAIYNVRLTGSNARPLVYINKRDNDRVNWLQGQSPGVPTYYDLFKQGGLGKIRLIDLGVSDTLVVSYYRRLNIPCSVSTTGTWAAPSTTITVGSVAGIQLGATITGTNIASGTYITAVNPSALTVTLSATTSSTGAATAVTIGGTTQCLDIPEDHTDGLIAWATHHFLANQGESGERLSYWAEYSKAAFEDARANNNTNEDEDMVFLAPDDLGVNWGSNPNAAVAHLESY